MRVAAGIISSSLVFMLCIGCSEDKNSTSDSGGTTTGSDQGNTSTGDQGAVTGDQGTGGVTPQATVQNATGVMCAGETVKPDLQPKSYPCDAEAPSAADQRKVLKEMTQIKFLAGHWASSDLPDGDCTKSTLCGQQFDPDLLYIRDPTMGSSLTKTMVNNIPGIDLMLNTSVADLKLLAFNCLRNFPKGYKMSNPPIPTVDPIMPTSDVRNGEVEIWSGTKIYRGRVEVTIEAKKPDSTDLTDAEFTFADGTKINTAGEAFAKWGEESTDRTVDLVVQARLDSEVAVEITFKLLCLQEDKELK